MNLDEAQKQTVATWIDGGLTISDIQSKLASEFGIKMTYMEVRFLMDDLKLRPKEKEARASIPTLEKGGLGQTQPIAKEPSGAPADLAEHSAGLAGALAVSVDQVTRPGAVVSGKVTFSDGNTSDWYLDQVGRLGLVPKQPGYRPSPEDLRAFQAELQRELGKLGF
jgi:hypothetical protein